MPFWFGGSEVVGKVKRDVSRQADESGHIKSAPATLT